MARPTTKAALLAAGDAGLKLLLEEIDALPPEVKAREFTCEGGDRTIRDVLCHLHEWHLLLIGWHAAGMRGARPDMPAPGHTWRSTPALNAALRAKHARTPIEEARLRLIRSHAAVRAIVSGHTDEELFTKHHYAWTRTASLGALMVSSTSAHYEWACTKVRRHRRACMTP